MSYLRGRGRFALSGLALLFAICALLAAPTGRAQAHGVQVASDPAPNSQLAKTPDLISVSFSETIEPSVSTIQLWDQSGKPVRLGDLVFFKDDSRKMAVRVPKALAPGIYTVIWRNLSTADGHTWAGSFPFTMLGAGGEVPTGQVADVLQKLAQAPSTRPSALDSAARWVVLLGTAVMLGGAAYVLFVAFPAARMLGEQTNQQLRHLSLTVLLVTTALGIFLVLDGSLLQLIIQAGRLGGLGRADELLTKTRLGHYLVARQALLLVALLAVVTAWRSERGRGLVPALSALFVVSFGVLLTESLVSHSAASEGPFWTTSIDVLHLLAAALWVGGLVHIAVSMPRWLDELSGVPRTVFAGESFRRFSMLAAVSVVVLLASGVLSALVQIGSFGDLWNTTYGRSLVGKIGAMLPLLGVAGLNAFILRPRVIEAAAHLAGGADDEGGPPMGVARLQRLLANAVRVEAALGVAVLIAAAVLIQLEPPQAAAAAKRASSARSSQTTSVTPAKDSFRGATDAGGLSIALRITPARVGQNSFELGLGSEFGGIGEVLEVRLDFQPPNPAVGGSRLPLQLAGSAKFTADGANLSLPGTWKVTANIRRRGEDDVRASFTVPVAEAGASGGAQDGSSGVTTSPASESIWHWPFAGKRSALAIAVLAVAGVIGGGYVALQLAQRRA